MTNNQQEQLSFNADGACTCSMCGTGVVREHEEFNTFTWGSMPPFTAPIPVLRCEACSYAFTDGRTDAIEAEAVRRFKAGRLSPSKVREIRKRLSLSRKELAELTQFGIASVKRWETGSIIQNHSADRILRLLDDDPSIVDRLREISTRLAKE